MRAKYTGMCFKETDGEGEGTGRRREVGVAIEGLPEELGRGGVVITVKVEVRARLYLCLYRSGLGCIYVYIGQG